ncbi:MAG TPA: DUF2188 domain-containing protein [Bacteroidetes bacterium]|nr:DUF2188 domain-containing protein [Bacteroidota bacterium]
MPIGISLFLILLVALEFVYFIIINFTLGIFAHHGYTFGNITQLSHVFVTVFLVVLLMLCLYFIFVGFIRREKWARKFTMMFILWAALWPVWGMFIGNIVVEHLAFFIIYVLMEIYLMTSYVKDYFKDVEIFRYGEWTLYVRMVKLKNDEAERPIYFFSKKIPKSGTPTAMPEGYEVGINERSRMPYLQKIGKPEVYKYGKYTLYTRKVKLVRGKEVDIYFFSSRKPKSGTQCPIPEGYEVGVSKRSNMPFLRKKKSKKTVTKKEEKVEEDIKKKSPNVVYVVSKPQPGEVRGDWAVRSRGKIFSHHKTKATAIKEARKIAKQRDATVLVQNTDGTFSDGFKPRKK